jgi:diaminopimelate epimerase
MQFEFTKMQALGNDYILINGYHYPELLKDARELSIEMSDRHFGVGADGIIFALPSEHSDSKMRMFNADGSESEMCGNGIRQLARFINEKGLNKASHLSIETLAGIREIELAKKGDFIESIKVNMGNPVFDPKLIPARAEINEKGFAQKKLAVLDQEFEFTLVSMGNPHAVAVVKSLEGFDVAAYGRVVENHTQVFPKRTNVEFIEILSKNEIRMRVWERGSGETLACGTGACASVAACVVNGLTDQKVKVRLLGGDLAIEWGKDAPVYMTGSAENVFEGTYNFN